MLFFNDECDFVDDDQYDLFTLGSEMQRRDHLRWPASDSHRSITMRFMEGEGMRLSRSSRS